MIDQIRDFNKQFEFQPVIENGHVGNYTKFVIAGMGGSHLAADLIKTREPYLDLIVHKDYGLPKISDESGRLFIASSYSGNTEEVVDFLESAIEKGLPTVVVSTGGKLIEIAKEKSIPFVKMPETNIQPREALGYSLRALLKAMGQNDILSETDELVSFDPSEYEELGKSIAEKIGTNIPVVYSSTDNEALALNWKIRLNETGKTPAFYNVLPELNHNEMISFADSSNFYFVLIREDMDSPRIKKRIDVTIDMLEKMGYGVSEITLSGSKFNKIFKALLVADWTSYYLAKSKGSNPEEVSLVEEFKKML